jgi:ABC-2 type transport system permease protein
MTVRYLLLEVWRQLKNVRSLVFTFALPIAMLLIFGSVYGSGGRVDPSTHLPWLVVTTVQMAGYGGMMASLGQAFTIVNERALGWNRQLRITPLSGTGYLATKIAAALAVAACSILLTFAVSMIALHTTLPVGGWVLAGVALWLGIVPFALIAILIGQFARPEFAQPLFMVTFFGMAILGGLWVPLQIMPAWVSNVAQIVPSYWLNKLGQMGALGSGDAMTPVVVLAVWSLALAALIVWRYRRDAARA